MKRLILALVIAGGVTLTGCTGSRESGESNSYQDMTCEELKAEGDRMVAEGDTAEYGTLMEVWQEKCYEDWLGEETAAPDAAETPQCLSCRLHTEGPEGKGSQVNPYNFGETFSLSEWEITVNSMGDATEIIREEYGAEYEQMMEDNGWTGFDWGLAELEVKYGGLTSGDPAYDIDVSFIGTDNLAYPSVETSDTREMYPEAVQTVRYAIPVAPEAHPGGVLSIAAGDVEVMEVFVKT